MKRLSALAILLSFFSFIWMDIPIDVHLQDALNQASNGNGISFFLLPDSDDYTNIPQDPLNPISEQKVDLGKLLYHETGLGLNPKKIEGLQSYSCATCHFSEAGFQANRPQGIGEGGSGIDANNGIRVKRDTYDEMTLDVQPVRSPTILNAAYQTNMLWNGQFGGTNLNIGTEDQWTEGTPKAINHLGFEGLETQAIAGLEVHRMKVDETVVNNLDYKDLFDAVFADIPQSERYTNITAGLAIAAYERTVLSNQSPFQAYLKGDKDALTEHQKKGALIFFEKANCASCHTGPGLNKMEFHAYGMKDLYQNPHTIFNADENSVENQGRGGFTKNEEDLFKFKVPQLYNLKDSPFYGHGASFNTVKEVIEYKNNAIKENTTVPQSNLSPFFTPQNLRSQDINALSDFIENALYDSDLNRYEPTQVNSGNCIPNNDFQSRLTLGCNNEYCESNGEEPWEEWIKFVDFGSINHESFKEWNPNGYGDYTNISTEVSQGQHINISLEPGYSWQQSEEHWRVWIDFNQNGSFMDEGEMVVDIKGANTQTTTVSIPGTAQIGSTRMRVSMSRNAAPSPCGTFKYGEVQDYTVQISEGEPFNFEGDLIVTGNRTNGDISVINAETDQVLTIPMPDAPNQPDFMYVNYDIHSDRVFIGDRANNRILALNAADFTMAGAVNFGADKGMFHMWLSPNGAQLWTVLDISKEIAIIDPVSLNTLSIIPIPSELAAQGGKPHDIIVSPDNQFVYVTILGGTLDTNYVIQYNTQTYQEVNRAAVGFDPHVSLTSANNKLYVASQNSNQLQILDRNTMQTLKVLPFDGAHGVGMSNSGRYLYVGNLPEKGNDAIGTLDLQTETFIGSPVDAFEIVPHNMVLTADDSKLYVTHTADNVNKVTVYRIAPNNPIPVFDKEIEVGFKPMGIALVSDKLTPPAEMYCESNGEEPWQEWIKFVDFGSINHESFKEWNPNGYGDYTNISTEVSQGQHINISLEPGYSWQQSEEHWRVWIDFNQNGSFMDEGEMVVDIKGANTQSTTVSIPGTAQIGSTRMRVSMSRNAAPSPCGTFKYGEVQDYTVQISEGEPFNFEGDLIVTGNRTNGDISVINAETDQVLTIPMPDAPNQPDFMYVNYDIHSDRVFIGDRANNRILALNAADFTMAGAVNFGADKGMFHMWLSPNGAQLWTVLDISKEIAIIDPVSLNTLSIIPIPSELAAQGGKPHDIIVSPDNQFVYVTILGGTLDTNYVIQYNTQTYQEVNRAAVGFDPHVSLTSANNKLYVASQNSNQLQILDRNTMQTLEVLPFDGAHGVGMSNSGRYLYVGNLPEKGNDAIGTLDLQTETFIGSPVDAFEIVPHNMVLTADDSKLYVTHTADNVNKVTVYRIAPNNPIPVFDKEIEVGFKPMGIALVSDKLTPPAEMYCESNGEEPWQEWIKSVDFGSINHESFKEWNPNGYGDYTNISTEVSQGQHINISLEPGYSWQQSEEHWRVWIDFNQNGSFMDEGEMVVDIKGANTQSTTVSIPGTAQIGSTRMRVSMSRNAAPSPCGTFKYGEVQDYTVQVESGQENTSRNLIATSNLVLSAFQKNGEVMLNWAANLTSETTNFIVEHSKDGENFDAIINRNDFEVAEMIVMKDKDEQPQVGTNFYRVVQEFDNGQIVVSPIKQVKIFEQMLDVSIYPNPVSDFVHLNLKSYTGKSATINIADSHGHLLQSHKVDKITKESIKLRTKFLNNHTQWFYLIIQIEGNKIITKKVFYAH